MLVRDLKKLIDELNDDDDVRFSLAIDTSINEDERWFASKVYDTTTDSNGDHIFFFVAESTQLHKDKFDPFTAGPASIAERVNLLAGRICAEDTGYDSEQYEGYPFYLSSAPIEKKCWDMAAMAFNELFDLDADEILTDAGIIPAVTQADAVSEVPQ